MANLARLARPGAAPPAAGVQSAGVQVRPATMADADAIRGIYNVEVETSTVTLDLVPRTLADQQDYLAARQGTYAVIVATDGPEVVGFGSLSPYRNRPGYNATAEDSVYVHRAHQGRGVGKVILTELVRVASAHGFHSVIARVSAGHQASRKLHEALGFGHIGTEREVGRKFGRWIDMDLLQRML
jgi:L-amino acid N-acyltransferase YncA